MARLDTVTVHLFVAIAAWAFGFPVIAEALRDLRDRVFPMVARLSEPIALMARRAERHWML